MRARQSAIVAFLVFGSGMLAGQWLGHAELTEFRAQVAEDQRLATRGAAQRLQAAQARGDVLTQQVAQHELQIQTLTKEKRDALKNTTSGRACLGPAALRVLDGAAGLRVADLPPTTGGAAAADARVATDSDLGQWALDAGAQYERCRERLDALIDWHRMPTHPEAIP
ncbi:hypothetical protein HNP55_003545 [Paucibacter oligotrophus]|uniref:Bacteriophage Rz lysis protein n=1 Tax=Roseateles oligotrophus TaxID=1769250 RepID=A0A840LG34_9BURK|nr:hypothetical protein [Roseateles oligotrophus]MBB4844999.1 hypothetical protein [Roseateles oligotrophus]